jgi:hypothetical protein
VIVVRLRVHRPTNRWLHLAVTPSIGVSIGSLKASDLDPAVIPGEFGDALDRLDRQDERLSWLVLASACMSADSGEKALRLKFRPGT